MIAELRRLILDQQFQAAERILAGFHNIGAAPFTSSLRQLCVSGAEQLRVAAELESAAHTQRLLAQPASAEPADRPGTGGQPGTTGRPEAARRPETAKPESGPELAPAAAEPVARAREPDPVEAEVTACVLGPLDLTVAGRRVTRWNSLKARTVFQYLVAQIGRPVRREVLMELMWPDHTPDSARNNLNAALYSLRNTLAQDGRKIQYIL